MVGAGLVRSSWSLALAAVCACGPRTWTDARTIEAHRSCPRLGEVEWDLDPVLRDDEDLVAVAAGPRVEIETRCLYTVLFPNDCPASGEIVLTSEDLSSAGLDRGLCPPFSVAWPVVAEAHRQVSAACVSPIEDQGPIQTTRMRCTYELELTKRTARGRRPRVRAVVH
jgi:hypothetical protein